MFEKNIYLYSLIVSMSNINIINCGCCYPDVSRDTDAARGHKDGLKQLFGNYRSFGNI